MEVIVKNVKKEFYRKSKESNVFTAVDTYSMELRANQFVIIKGRSGSGKSTLMNMMSGILQPTEGEILYDGEDLYKKKDEELSKFRNETIGYIPQGKSAIASLNVLENILLPDLLFGSRDEDNAIQKMEQFDILSLKDAMPEELSGGELRRMSIVRALIKNPKVIFADEPTGDLDDENTKLVFDMLRKIADEGTAVLVVTHDAEADEYADVIYRMNAGKLIQEK